MTQAYSKKIHHHIYSNAVLLASIVIPRMKGLTYNPMKAIAQYFPTGGVSVEEVAFKHRLPVDNSFCASVDECYWVVIHDWC